MLKRLTQLTKAATDKIVLSPVEEEQSEMEKYIEAKSNVLMAFNINLAIFGLKKLCGEKIENSRNYSSLVTLRQIIEKMKINHKKFESLLEDADLYASEAVYDPKLDLRPNILQELEGTEEAEEADRFSRRVKNTEFAADTPKEATSAPASKEQLSYSDRRRSKKILKNPYFADVARQQSDRPVEKDLEGRELSKRHKTIDAYEESNLRRYREKKEFKKANTSFKSDPQLVNFGGFSEFNDLKNVFGEKGKPGALKKKRKQF